jgi:quercetin dioxygenase-like cupin family protein
VAADGTAAAKDLSVEEPRALGVELDGYAHVPRMLDKARATLAGTAGTYMFGCPVDHTCMARLGIAPDLVLELAARHADDRAVLAELREHGVPAAPDAWFDAQAVEDELDERGYVRVRRRDALPERDAGRLFAGAEHGAEVDVLLVEAGPGEHGDPREPATAEVWTVVEGWVTLYLGDQQARTVRDGEIVRVPAGMPLRWETPADSGVRAVVARPAPRGR